MRFTVRFGPKAKWTLPALDNGNSHLQKKTGAIIAAFTPLTQLPITKRLFRQGAIDEMAV